MYNGSLCYIGLGCIFGEWIGYVRNCEYECKCNLYVDEIRKII